MSDGFPNPSIPTGDGFGNPSYSTSFVFRPQPGQDAVSLPASTCRRPSACRRQIAVQPPNDLAAAGFWQDRGEMNVVGHGQRADLFADVVLQFLPQFLGRIQAAGQSDEDRDGFAFDVVGRPTAAASATAGWLTRALSISMVLSRCPETFNTSSMRPMIQ